MKQSTRSIFVILLSTMIMLSACNSMNAGTTNKPSESESGTSAWVTKVAAHPLRLAAVLRKQISSGNNSDQC